jgi:hypothetical protein
MRETGPINDQRPEEIDHALSQSADSEQGDLAPSTDYWTVQRLVVRGGQRALRGEDQNGACRYARVKQMEQTRHAHCRLAGTGRPFEKGLAPDRTLNEHALQAGKR